METLTKPAATAQEVDFLPIMGTDYVEFYVGNARRVNFLMMVVVYFRKMLVFIK